MLSGRDNVYDVDMRLLAERSPTEFLVPVLLVAVLIAFLIGVVAVVRRRMVASSTEDALNDPMAGFSLSNLRQLVKEGKMTPEEYEAAKNQIVAVAQRKANEAKPAAGPAVEHKLPEEL
jgi:hypothetical protein